MHLNPEYKTPSLAWNTKVKLKMFLPKSNFNDSVVDYLGAAFEMSDDLWVLNVIICSHE
jgi:hypothetical protein